MFLGITLQQKHWTEPFFIYDELRVNYKCWGQIHLLAITICNSAVLREDSCIAKTCLVPSGSLLLFFFNWYHSGLENKTRPLSHSLCIQYVIHHTWKKMKPELLVNINNAIVTWTHVIAYLLLIVFTPCSFENCCPPAELTGHKIMTWIWKIIKQ